MCVRVFFPLLLHSDVVELLWMHRLNHSFCHSNPCNESICTCTSVISRLRTTCSVAFSSLFFLCSSSEIEMIENRKFIKTVIVCTNVLSTLDATQPLYSLNHRKKMLYDKHAYLSLGVRDWKMLLVNGLEFTAISLSLTHTRQWMLSERYQDE